MTDDRIGRYLDDLARALRARGAYSAGIVEEVRDHLRDAMEAAQCAGLSDVAAEDEALTRVGAPELLARHAALDVPRLRRGMLLAVCAGTIASIGFLSLSLLILRPPRANYSAWTAEAAFVFLLTAVTWVWAKAGDFARQWVRPLLMLGNVSLAALGAGTFYVQLTRHFDGYGVVLASLFILQALLTVSHPARWSRGASSPR